MEERKPQPYLKMSPGSEKTSLGFDFCFRREREREEEEEGEEEEERERPTGIETEKRGTKCVYQWWRDGRAVARVFLVLITTTSR